MTSTLYPWQYQAWAQLQQLHSRWPHAILLHGPKGIGKTHFAEWLAQSLLCESPLSDGQACGMCISCGWFSQYSHPDYRRLRPEILETDSAEGHSAEQEEAPAADTKSTSKSTGLTAKSARAPSKEIVINQVRNLSEFMTISTHRQGRRVIVIYPAESMNTSAANAILKSLEEPGPDTIFILVTSSVNSLLPTLISRCHQFALSLPEIEQAAAWLAQQNTTEPEQFLAEQGGAPLAAFAASQADTQEQQQEFFRYLHQPDVNGALKTANKLQKTSISLIVSWMQRWLYDLFSFKLSGKIRYYPRYRHEIERIAALVNLSDLLTLLDENTQRCAVAEHPLSHVLVLEEMLLDYVQSCDRL
ncbi:MAG: holB [Solimicrobium sp.]|nr:holB [Solimicrobium sp.]